MSRTTPGPISIMPQPDSEPQKKPRYFERPDQDEKPLSLIETAAIVLSSHLGVRSREQRHEDFRRANGLHLFIAGLVYFALILTGLVLLVRHIAG